MSEPRFFLPAEAFRGDRVVFPAAQSHQIARVLRLHPGAPVFVLDNAGSLYTVQLERVSPREVVGRIVGVEPAGNEPPLELWLYQALLKGDRMDFVLQKGTEIGVRRFIPMVTERTVVRRWEKRPRWERIVTEAAEQCRRGRVPEVAPVCSFAEALEDLRDAAGALIAHNADDVPPLREVLEGWPARPDTVALLIGPEGGFSDAEVAQAMALGVRAVRLGPRTLRSETAALVATTLLLYHWGDIGR